MADQRRLTEEAQAYAEELQSRFRKKSMANRRRLTKETRAYVEELQSRIRGRFPAATFRSYWSDEPAPGVYVDTYVDTEDEFDVLDLVNDRAVDILVETGIPIYVIPLPSSTPEASGAMPSDGQPQQV